jgi:nicotinamidase-related amidase
MSAETAQYLRSHELLSRDNSLLVVVDIQEKLLPAIPVRESLIESCRMLLQGAKLLRVPIAATEQYPRGLGPIVPEIRQLLDGNAAEKVRFSCAECLRWPTAAERDDQRWQVVLCGMEAHVCVLQTALDLLAAGYRVYIPADAVASRRKLDWKIGLERMSSAGATITTIESVLFEWCEVSGTPEFKEISRLIKERDQHVAARPATA